MSFFDALPINQFEKVNNFWFEKELFILINLRLLM